jgi:hypothetical protein
MIMKNPFLRRLLTISTLVLATGALAACVQQTATSKTTQAPVVAPNGTVPAGQPEQNVVRFSDLPMPPQSRMDTEKSIILGTGESWTGRVLIEVPGSAETAFDYYRKTLPELGWREITAVRAATSVLTYLRDGRVATLQLKRQSQGGTQVIVTVSPEGNAPAKG